MTSNPSKLRSCVGIHVSRLTCLYFTAKVENRYLSANEFVKKVSCLELQFKASDVLSYEFLVATTLKFNFTIHHAYRPLQGLYELLLVLLIFDR